MKMKLVIGTIVGIVAASILVSCSDDSDSANNASSSFSYNGPGSEWTMSRTGTTYNIDYVDGSDTLDITATGESLSTGHLKLTVTAATAGGSATAPSVGSIGHAIEVNGTAMLIKPMEANSETIAMVASGSCPSADFTANWVIGGRAAGANTKITDNDGDWYGSITWDTSGGSATFPRYRSVEDPTRSADDNQGPQTIGTCSSGKVTASGIQAYFTASGLVIVGTNMGTSDESHIIGIPQAAIGTATSIHGDYAGFIYDQHNNDSFAVTATMGAGTGTAGDLVITTRSGNNLETTGTAYTAQFNTGNVDSIASGIMHGTFSTCTAGNVTQADGTCELVCTVSKNVNSSGRNLLYCVGQHPSDENDRITVLLFQNE